MQRFWAVSITLPVSGGAVTNCIDESETWAQDFVCIASRLYAFAWRLLHGE